MKTEILTGGSELIDELSGEWAELCDEGASAEPFLRPEWFAAFVDCFENQVYIVTVRRDGKLRALLPLVKKAGTLHGIPVRKLQAVYNLNTQRFDLIHGGDEDERKAIVKAVWFALKDMRGWDVVETRLVKKNSWLHDVLDHAEQESYKTGVWPMDAAPFIMLPQADDTPSAIAAFFKGPRKHLRQELDRRLRRLQELGTVEFATTTTFSPELTQTFFDLEGKGWKGRQGTAVVDDPVVVRLHDDFAQAVADSGSLLIYELKLGCKTIAMSINIRYSRETVHWKTTYDEEYSRYSPGNLLFRELLKDCIECGSNEIDFLSPSSPNKLSWATGEREHVAFYIFDRSLWGMLLWNWKFRFVLGLQELRDLRSEKRVLTSATR